MMKWSIWLMLAATAVPVAATDESGGGTLTLEQALAWAHRVHPGLAAAAVEVDAAVAAARQAEAWPNPAFFFKLEAAPRDGQAWHDGERIYGIAQVLPLSGRIGAAGAVADARTAQVRRESELHRRDTEAGVRSAFARAVHARDVLELNREAVRVAQRLHDLVAERAVAGDTPVADRRRARMALGVVQAGLMGAEALDAAARSELAVAVGDPTAADRELVATPATDLAPPPLGEILIGLDGAPRLQLADSRLAEQEALITEASRRRWPDLALEAALRDSPLGNAYDVGVAVELPLWDRGGARVSSARAGAVAADHRRRSVQQDLEARVRQVHARLAAAAGELAVYDDVVLPEASAALRAAEAAYGAGDADLTGVLQITRDWHDARRARLDRRLAVALAWAELYRLR